MKLRVGIIGSHGMLGQELVRAFADVSCAQWDHETCDITNMTGVASALQTASLDILINAAAYNNVDSAETAKGHRAAFAVNAEGPRILASWCRQHDVRFMHISTDYVFDGTQRVPYREDDVPHPLSNYARSKDAGEKNVQQEGGDWLIVRTSRLFGRPGASGRAKKSFVDIVRQFAERGGAMRVVDDERASPTLINDLAHALRDLACTASSGIYHLVNTGDCTWYEFAQEICRMQGYALRLVPMTSQELARPAIRPAYSVLANTKTKPLRSWQEALRAYFHDATIS